METTPTLPKPFPNSSNSHTPSSCWVSWIFCAGEPHRRPDAPVHWPPLIPPPYTHKTAPYVSPPLCCPHPTPLLTAAATNLPAAGSPGVPVLHQQVAGSHCRHDCACCSCCCSCVCCRCDEWTAESKPAHCGKGRDTEAGSELANG
jgi:hypothetical protein